MSWICKFPAHHIDMRASNSPKRRPKLDLTDARFVASWQVKTTTKNVKEMSARLEQLQAWTSNRRLNPVP